jgi:hypothetical protein
MDNPTASGLAPKISQVQALAARKQTLLDVSATFNRISA